MIKKLDVLDSIIPVWKLDELIERQCPFCRSESNEERYIRPDQLSVRKCNSCNTYFVSPSPSESHLNAIYSKYDECFRMNKVQQNDYACLDPMDDIQIQEITSMIDLKGKACLDVGFGRGYLLRYFQILGADVYGVDLDPNAIYIAKEFLKINSVVEGTVFDLDDNKK